MNKFLRVYHYDYNGPLDTLKSKDARHPTSAVPFLRTLRSISFFLLPINAPTHDQQRPGLQSHVLHLMGIIGQVYTRVTPPLSQQ